MLFVVKNTMTIKNDGRTTLTSTTTTNDGIVIVLAAVHPGTLWFIFSALFILSMSGHDVSKYENQSMCCYLVLILATEQKYETRSSEHESKCNSIVFECENSIISNWYCMNYHYHYFDSPGMNTGMLCEVKTTIFLSFLIA